jgi:hypothetical protein
MRCPTAIRGTVASIAFFSFLVTAATGSAGAATLYVDVETGDDQAGANTCLTQPAPCKSIGNALLASGASDEILVDDGDYAEAGLTIDSNKILRASGFEGSDTGAAIIDPGNSPNPVLTAALGSAGRIEGFTIGNDSARLIEVNGPATIANNTFDETAVGAPTPHLLITAVAGDPTISGNVFDKAAQSGGTAIRTLSADSPLITGNRIENYNGSIDIRAGTPQVTGNQITGQTGAGSCDPCAGIYVLNAQPTLTANTLSDPITTSGTGISITEFAGAGATGATLSRNLIRGGLVSVGVQQFGGSFGPLSLSSDLLSDYTETGLDSQGDLTATNVTVASSAPSVASDVELTNNADLVLDSSIVDEDGIASTTSTCAITFSRGPTTSGGSCESFQTAVNPLFRDQGAGDYRLVGNSLLIDAGNPAASPAGALDVAGNPRVLASPRISCPPAAPGPAIRDMGAYEYVLDHVPPVPACPPTTDPGPETKSKKKCKKRKGKKGKRKRRCAKKKPKKRS